MTGACHPELARDRGPHTSQGRVRMLVIRRKSRTGYTLRMPGELCGPWRDFLPESVGNFRVHTLDQGIDFFRRARTNHD